MNKLSVIVSQACEIVLYAFDFDPQACNLRIQPPLIAPGRLGQETALSAGKQACDSRITRVTLQVYCIT